MKVSLIIPTYNKLPRLKLTLASLENQTYPYKDYEVVLVDDGSTDGTKLFIESFEPLFELKYIRQSNRGRSAARNEGLRRSQGELIIFVDDDLILHPGFIEQHLNKQRELPCVLHGKIVNLPYLKFFEDPANGSFYPHLNIRDSAGNELRSKCISEEDIKKRFEEAIYPNNKMTSFEQLIREVLLGEIEEYQWIGFTGGNVSVPGEWLNSVRGFDENLGAIWGCEDLELGYRLYKKGHPFYYNDNAVNYHMVHFRQDFGTQLEAAFTYFYEKHGDTNILRLQDFLLEKLSRKDFIDTMT